MLKINQFHLENQKWSPLTLSVTDACTVPWSVRIVHTYIPLSPTVAFLIWRAPLMIEYLPVGRDPSSLDQDTVASTFFPVNTWIWRTDPEQWSWRRVSPQSLGQESHSLAPPWMAAEKSEWVKWVPQAHPFRLLFRGVRGDPGIREAPVAPVVRSFRGVLAHKFDFC